MASQRTHSFCLPAVILEVALFLFLSLPVSSAPTSRAMLRVTYPRDGQSIAAIDSMFILGSTAPGWSVQINDIPATSHKDGGWLAFVPVTSGDFVFRVVASSGANRDTLSLNVSVPSLPEPDSCTATRIYSDYRFPTTPQHFAVGDRVYLQFRGTPGCIAWVSIPGISDSIVMSETAGQEAPFASGLASAVFAGEDSVTQPRVLGIYQGSVLVSERAKADSLRAVFHISLPSNREALIYFRNREAAEINFAVLNFLHPDQSSRASSIDSSAGLFFCNSGQFPRAVEFLDTTQIMRVGPRAGYLGIFQPAGILAEAIGADGEWLRLRLSESQVGLVNRASCKLLEEGIHPPRSWVSRLRAKKDRDRLIFEVPLSARHPFAVRESDAHTIVVELFGVTMNTDWLREEFGAGMVEDIVWRQAEPGLYEITIHLREKVWGYDASYVGNVLTLSLRKAPSRHQAIGAKALAGLTIVVDPGHSAEPGSIGPTGYTEADANLGIALALRDSLVARGARVVMTRSNNADVPLYKRPAIADSVDADLFISVHNNSCPDGVDPLTNHGVSTYYYHRHSRDLAKAVLGELLKLPGQIDHGLYFGNLAVCRPTNYPAVLVECAFMILPDDEALLKTNTYRSRVASAISRGVESFVKDAL